MYLCKEEVEKILEIMNRFPDAKNFMLEQDSSSGIGSVTSLTVFTEVSGYDGEFKIEISGVENW